MALHRRKDAYGNEVWLSDQELQEEAKEVGTFILALIFIGGPTALCARLGSIIFPSVEWYWFALAAFVICCVMYGLFFAGYWGAGFIVAIIFVGLIALGFYMKNSSDEAELTDRPKVCLLRFAEAWQTKNGEELMRLTYGKVRLEGQELSVDEGWDQLNLFTAEDLISALEREEVVFSTIVLDEAKVAIELDTAKVTINGLNVAIFLANDPETGEYGIWSIHTSDMSADNKERLRENPRED